MYRHKQIWLVIVAISVLSTLLMACMENRQANAGERQTAAEAKQPAPGTAEPAAGMQVNQMSGVAPRVGDMAPAFELTDLDGATHRLADYSGKLVVLEWFNPGCPYVVAYYEGSQAMNSLKAQLPAEQVVWLRVNSGAAGKEGADPAMNREKAAAWGIDTPILVDSAGTVGKAYGAKRTPELVLIGTDGKVAYRGAADEGGINGDAGNGRAFLLEAVQAVMNGEAPAVLETRQVGCSVKY